MSVKKFLKDVEKIGAAHAHKKEQKSAEKAHDDESNWLVSYADMMTLLCGFFIMMFSMAHLDEPKYEALKEAVAKQFHGKYSPPPTKDLAQEITNLLDENGLSQQTIVRWDPSGASIVFQSAVFFDTLSADVRPQGRAVLDKLIGVISQQESKAATHYRIAVEGHTDGKPIMPGSAFPSNWELSGARASSVVRLFAAKGFTPGRLVSLGYGDTRPEFASRLPSGEWDEAALGKNRRVIVRVLDPRSDAIPFPEYGENETQAATAASTAALTAQAATAPLPSSTTASIAGTAQATQASTASAAQAPAAPDRAIASDPVVVRPRAPASAPEAAPLVATPPPKPRP